MSNNSAEKFIKWFDEQAKPFLSIHAPEKLAPLQGDYDRLIRMMAPKEDMTVCFLGNSGVGKSTLLNAIAAENAQVLPAGGIGPLTAQATEVHYSDVPMFRVTYHPKSRLWKMAFALEGRLNQKNRKAEKTEVQDIGSQLSEEDKKDILLKTEPIETDPAVENAPSDLLEGYIKQAKNIVCQDQFKDCSLEYLVDGLRVACGYEKKWGSELEASDAIRLQRINKILSVEKNNLHYESRIDQVGETDFLQDLRDHAAGFLSPLIEKITVGWNSDVLKGGVKLVDLPGVGIAQDAYRDVTKEYVREKARAVIIVVDRAGPTESTIDLLRISGYWDRLISSADDPASDPCTLLVAVTKVDDVANSEWQNSIARPRPRKRDVYIDLVEKFKLRMRNQVCDQLSKIGDSNNASVQEARKVVREEILKTLEIHPVSAPELARIIYDDEDDRSFLREKDDTGIPGLQRSLVKIAQGERDQRAQQIAETQQRLMSATINELSFIEAAWQEDNRAAEEAERLQVALDEVLNPKKNEYRARVAQFREFLKETVDAKIEALVLEAREEAENEVYEYLERLRDVHWATLRAAVCRGGAFHGRTNINLPADISGYFQEPMAAVWGQKLLKIIRKRTSDLANDIEQMVNEICEWAKNNAGVQLNKKVIEAQQQRIAVLASQMRVVGKEAVDEMRETVKNELLKTIETPIRKACDAFVHAGNAHGRGVRNRILDLFSDLAKKATQAAKKPAIQILAKKAALVRDEIQAEFEKGGDPLQDTANLIIQRHEDRIRRSDAQKRKSVLNQVEVVLNSYPN